MAGILQLATTLDRITFFGLLQAEFINLSGFIFDKLLPPRPNPDQNITNIISKTARRPVTLYDTHNITKRFYLEQQATGGAVLASTVHSGSGRWRGPRAASYVSAGVIALTLRGDLWCSGNRIGPIPVET